MRPTLYTPSGAKVALMPEPEAIGAWTIPATTPRAPVSRRQSSLAGGDAEANGSGAGGGGGGGVGSGGGIGENNAGTPGDGKSTEVALRGRPKRRRWANNFRGGSVTPMDSQG